MEKPKQEWGIYYMKIKLKKHSLALAIALILFLTLVSSASAAYVTPISPKIGLVSLRPNADFKMEGSWGTEHSTGEWGPIIAEEKYFYDTSTSKFGIVSWYWTFQDGPWITYSTEQNPVKGFTWPGDNKITLTVTNSLGLSSTITKTYHFVNELE